MKRINHEIKTEYVDEITTETKKMIKGKEWVNKEVKIINRILKEVEKKWCYKCEMWLPLTAFNKNKRAWDGLQLKCKKCRSIKKSLEPSVIESITPSNDSITPSNESITPNNNSITPRTITKEELLHQVNENIKQEKLKKIQEGLNKMKREQEILDDAEWCGQEITGKSKMPHV